MSSGATGYRGSQVIAGNGNTENTMMTADATYQDFLHIMGGDVAATLAWIRDLGMNPPGMPVPSVSLPLTATQAVIQDPALAPAQLNVYDNLVLNYTPVLGGRITISAVNEVTTGIQPNLMLCLITSPKCLMLQKAMGSNGIATITQSSYSLYNNYRVYAGGMIIGKSKLSYYSTNSPVLGAPSISNTNGVIRITPPTAVGGSALQNVRLEWRRKSANWIWQPYVGPFTKPSGSYTIQARALRYGFNDTNATVELAVT